jgi:hypothetical protein
MTDHMFATVLADETTSAMRLLGVKNVSELGPQHVSVFWEPICLGMHC